MPIEYDATGKIYRCRLGAGLRKRRKALGLTVFELAAASGTSSSAISYYELEKGEPTITNLYRMLVALGTTLEDVIKEG